MFLIVCISTIICCMFYAVTDWYLIKIFYEKGIFMPWIGVIILFQSLITTIPIMLLLA